jgi:hypothetical protein
MRPILPDFGRNQAAIHILPIVPDGKITTPSDKTLKD